VATLFNFRTQFFKGYTYTSTSSTFASNFLSPAYVLLSLGLDFRPTPNFSLFLSPVTARWVIVKDDVLAAKGSYGIDPGEHHRSELGAFLSASYLKQVNPNIAYKGRLDLFSNYLRNPEKIDVFMTNVLAMKLTKFLSVTWNVDLIYDDDVRMFGDDGKSPAWQLKSIVGLGLLLRF
jgi:hypothetical protein